VASDVSDVSDFSVVSDDETEMDLTTNSELHETTQSTTRDETPENVTDMDASDDSDDDYFG
jgi:hypothetical protein